MKLIDQHTPVTIHTAATAPRGAAIVICGDDEGGFESARLPSAARRAFELLLTAKAFPSKQGRISAQAFDGGTLLAVNMGTRKTRSIHSYRSAAGVVARYAREHGLRQVAMLIEPSWMPGSHEIAGAFATGLCNGFFQLTSFKGATENSKADKASLVATLVVDSAAERFAAAAARRAQVIASSQNFARALAGHPGNVLNPPVLAKISQEVAKGCGLKCSILDEKQMARLSMGGMLGVGMGSPHTPPRMIVLEWPGLAGKSKADANRRPLLLVGKAITFDTGGISIKPREGMQRMVFDKCGAMTVIGSMIALARTAVPQRVIGILAAAENHVSHTAYRPGDILTMHNGVTVEVTNTDAEGRLVLADALSWGIKSFKPSAVIDLATLTGGVVVALGKEFAGMFANHDGLAAEIAAAGSYQGEKLWRLPMSEEVREMMKSDQAHMVNSAGRHAHAIQGAEFLRRFVPEDGSTPWAHLDIAGVADNEKATSLYSPGATGWGVRTLVDFITARSRQRDSRG